MSAPSPCWYRSSALWRTSSRAFDSFFCVASALAWSTTPRNPSRSTSACAAISSALAAATRADTSATDASRRCRSACACTSFDRAVCAAAPDSLTCCWSCCCLSDCSPRARPPRPVVARATKRSAARTRSWRMAGQRKQHQPHRQHWPRPWPWGSGSEEAAEPDAGADDADDEAEDEHPEGDPGGVAAGHEELGEEAAAVVERLVEAEVLEGGHRDDGQAGPDEALDHPLGDERDAHEPVRRADELHHLDLAPAGERRQPDRVHDEEQRRREEHEAKAVKEESNGVGDVDEALERLTGRRDRIHALLGPELALHDLGELGLLRHRPERVRQVVGADAVHEVGVAAEDALELGVRVGLAEVPVRLDVHGATFVLVEPVLHRLDLLIGGLHRHEDLERHTTLD